MAMLHTVTLWWLSSTSPTRNPSPKRHIRRQTCHAHAVTATPPPLAIQEPPSRIVPTPTPPAIAPPTETMAPPVRDLWFPGSPQSPFPGLEVPLFRPTLGPIQPTEVRSWHHGSQPDPPRMTTFLATVEPTACHHPPMPDTSTSGSHECPRQTTPSTDSTATHSKVNQEAAIPLSPPVTRLETAGQLSAPPPVGCPN